MTKKKPPYTQLNLFVIDTLDVAIKDDMASMEHPFYSLSKNPTREPKVYNHKGVTIEFAPSPKGFPTIYDKDLIIYAISHLMSALEEGQEIPQEVEFNPYHFLKFTRRCTGGRAYDALVDSVDRLKGSYFKTNFKIGDTITDSWRGIVDEADIESDQTTKKPRKIRIKLSAMVIETLKRKEVLTLNRDYFDLKKPIERRLYELARKHCGQQENWSPYLATLHVKSGSLAKIREFRRSVKSVSEDDNLPDYHILFDSTEDRVHFYPRISFQEVYSKRKPELPPLPTWAYQKAKNFLSGRQDVYAVEASWREFWQQKGCPKFDNYIGAFFGFCKQYSSQEGEY